MVRFKNRYALCEVVTPGTQSSLLEINSQQVYSAVRNVILDTHGEFGLGSLQFSLKVKYLNIETRIVIIRAERRFFHYLSSALVFVKKIGVHNAFLRTIHVGGSIRACQKFLIRFHRQNMTRLFPQCTTDEQRCQVMASIMDACEELEAPGRRSKPLELGKQPSTALDILNSGEQR
ncbi:ribonuclease P/MRP protein subunit POP5 [Aplysia californica]|uniref:Ribonuclease P/MRP protein subunit POP5 n=1 Tax=Aplysia californica TaxID=6500 RepID=A0ABM0KAF0_APLCA|nr:ribonuclease P/MRP protein subunit POP5 [Aplysia californica]